MKIYPLLALAMIVPTTSAAQPRIAVGAEGYATVAQVTGEWADEDELEPGVGLGGALTLDFGNVIRLYGGLDRLSFEIGDDPPGAPPTDANKIDTGFRAGIDVSFPLAVGATAMPFVRVGGVLHRTRLVFGSGDAEIERESENGLGGEVGIGASVDVGPVNLRPLVFFRSHPADFEIETVGPLETTLRYYGAMIALGFRR